MFNETILDINDQLDNFFLSNVLLIICFLLSFREDKLQLET